MVMEDNGDEVGQARVKRFWEVASEAIADKFLSICREQQ